MLKPTQFHVPDMLRNWPWPRKINPNHDLCAAESKKWFLALVPDFEKVHNCANPSLLCSLSQSRVSPAGLRVICDMMATFLFFDEKTDFTTEAEARAQANIVMDALRNPFVPRPPGESIGGELTRSFWLSAIKIVPPTIQRQFIEDMQAYTDAVVKQAEDRDRSRLRDVDSYLAMRCEDSGGILCLDLTAVEMDLPQQVFDDPAIIKIRNLGTRMIAIANDILSFNVESARGDTHNFVHIVMDKRKCDLTEAVRWISDYHDKLSEEFIERSRSLPSFGGEEIDEQVRLYVDDVANWVRGNWEWSFEIERYFGKKGAEVKKTGVVELLPHIITEPDDKQLDHVVSGDT